jgi:hypothetical protein
MKTLKITLASVALVTMLSSCDDGKKEMAQQQVDAFEAYTDSISDLAAEQAAENWEAIEGNYQEMKVETKNAVGSVKENSDLQMAMDETALKYETYKAEAIAENERIQQAKLKTALRQSLLGAEFSGDDMKFTWINKDNILSVYLTFVHTVENNKDSYSREDWDEIKLLYEAIDTRKNTVENEGLKSSDNREIAALKLKFAPMYTLNRMGAKSNENAKAKQ